MTEKSALKKRLILEAAHQVFIRKGFTAATMTDIVEQCGISRGGLYRYYSSTEELFRALMSENTDTMRAAFEDMMGAGMTFRDIMELFIQEQKVELLEIHHSLMTAAYEFFLSHKSAGDRELLRGQYEQNTTLLAGLISYGNQRGELEVDSAPAAASRIVVFIEGLRVLSLSVELTEAFITEQLGFIQNQLYGRNNA
ncbi:TetR/AcrR family transcriptional regulator [Paenibacillus donghaensis]|uniref:HTH tetR-type domain-containing protein n=1 Tax=Paenibacillus donghaensis TaxID=414771 RepID=A0A2Z2KR59_9BACL|nr:TetR/AcrR family transcriptional regulator [Paenibacillus donghaensis]ASA21438.1 hypothetical protein B9T62_12010 [Paenibacillus donghaensis]